MSASQSLSHSQQPSLMYEGSADVEALERKLKTALEENEKLRLKHRETYKEMQSNGDKVEDLTISN